MANTITHTSEKVLPYVYKVTNKETSEFYIGYRYKNVDLNLSARQDIGIKYWTSGNIKSNFKNNPQNFNVEILLESNYTIKNPSNDKDELVVYWYEQLLIRDNIQCKLCLNGFYINPDHYTKAFKCIPGNNKGRVVVVDALGVISSVLISDPRYISRELVGHTFGKTTVKDSVTNAYMSVNKDDPRIKSGELLYVGIGLVTVKDSKGNISKVSIDDPRFISGELVGNRKGSTNPGLNKGKVAAKFVISGLGIQVDIDDPRLKSGELVGVGKYIKQEILICPHCNIIGGVSNMKRFHFDNCKIISNSNKGRTYVKSTCPHCNFTGAGGSMKRFHFDNCKIISNSNKGRIYVKSTCPHCNFIGSGGNMKRFHFDNCKLNVS